MVALVSRRRERQLADRLCRDVDDQLFPGSPPDNGVPQFTDPNTGRGWPATKGYPSGPGWDACTGLGVIDGGALLAALEGVFDKDCQFILDRTQFGKNEVSAAGTPALIQNAFYVIVDGFTAPQLKITAIDPTKPPVVSPNFTSTLSGMRRGDVSAGGRRFSTAENAAAVYMGLRGKLHGPERLQLLAGQRDAQSLDDGNDRGDCAGHGHVELVLDSDPFELDGPVSWLSTDLRVFQIFGTNATLPGLPTVMLGNTGNATKDATDFIQAVIGGFNADTSPPPSHPFDQISTDEQVSAIAGGSGS